MKKTLRIVALGLLLAGTLLLSCARVEEPFQQEEIIDTPQQPGIKTTYTLTIKAVKGEDDQASTKALGFEGNALKATWAEGERVTVYNETTFQPLEGELIAQSSGPSTILSGTITGTVEEGDALSLHFLSAGYDAQEGTLDYIANNCDYAVAVIKIAGVAGGVITPEETGVSFKNQQAIVKFTLRNSDNTAAVNAKPMQVTLGTHTYTVTPDDAASELFVAIPAISNKNLRLIATTTGGSYAFSRAGVSFENGKYYAISVKMTNAVIATTEAELRDAVTDHPYPYIILGNDITLSKHVPIGGSINTVLDLDGHTLKRNLTTLDSNGNVFRISAGGQLTIRDNSTNQQGVLSDGKAADGGCIWNKGHLIIEGGTITDCKTDHEGGAIANYSGATVEMKGGTIEHCAGGDGGGIWNQAGGTLIITGGTINDCSSVAGGGGIVNKGTATISGCTISNNTATTRGGGIWNNGTLTLSDSDLTENFAQGVDESNGGGIHLAGGTATLSNARLAGNEAFDAGGIYVTSGAVLNLQGGSSITDNISIYHGGGGITNYGIITMTDAVTISGNSCQTNGGGIWSNGTLNMEGDIIITDNEVADVDGFTDDIYLTNGHVINVTGALTGGEESIGVRTQTPVVFTNGYESHNPGNTGQFFPSGTINGIKIVNGEGKMVYGYYEATWNSTSKKVEYTVSYIPDNVTVYNICSSMFASGGGLSDSQWFVADGTGTTSNGLTCGSGVRHVILCDGATITINGGLYVNSGSTLYIHCQSYSGRMGKLISQNTMSDNPGIGGKGSENKSTGTIIIHGGEIDAKGGEDAAGIGGGESYSCGTVEIYGGTVNAVGGDDGAGIGGGQDSSGGSVTVYGGSITCTGGSCAAGIGGGCRGNDCSITVFDCYSLTATGGGCDSSDRGGAGIGGGYHGRTGTVTIYGGTVKANGTDGGAGIGSGCDNSQGGAINIHGGNVEANGGAAHEFSPPTDAGAGIGTGGREMLGNDDIQAGHINIYGGTVKAYGGQGAPNGLGAHYGAGAGIGSGGEAAGAGTIYISGGDVTAYGGAFEESADYDAAGIGGGFECPGADVNIVGGTVIAKTGQGGSSQAIGHGYYSDNPGSPGNLELPDFHSVKAGVSPGKATLWPYNQRKDGCRQFWVKIEACTHTSESDPCEHCLYWH